MDGNRWIELERRYWDAMKDKDGRAARELTAQRCLLAGASGLHVIGADQIAAMLEGASWAIESYDLQDVQVVELTADVAAVGSSQGR